MEITHLVSSLSHSTSFIFIVIFLLLLLIKIGKGSKARKLPPGPWKLPIIGSLHHLDSGLQVHRTYRKLSKTHGPLMHLQLGEISTYVVSSPQVARSVLKTHDLAIADRITFLGVDIMSYNHSGIIFTPYGDHWRQMRKICITHLLNSNKVRSFKSIREQEVSDLIGSIERSSVGRPVDLSAKLSSLSSSIICRAIFGEKFSVQQDSLAELVRESSTLLTGISFADLFPSLHTLNIPSGTKTKVRKLHNEMNKLMEEIMNKRRDQYESDVNREENLLDILSRLQKQNELEFPITDNIIKAVILEMFAGGMDTTTSTVEWAMSEMIKNPRVRQKAQSELRLTLKGKNNVEEIVARGELGYLNLVIKETLRLHPPLALVGRNCREPCEINGYEIPEKAWVIINVWAIGRDPETWIDAESFVPERFEKCKVEYTDNNYEYTPFGGGRRVCPGIMFGLSVVELALAQLLYHFDWKLPHGFKPEDLDMSETIGLSTERKNHLHLIPNLNGR